LKYYIVVIWNCESSVWPTFVVWRW